MKDEVREKILARTKRISGQVAGIQRMIEQDRYCVDILNQISALRSALDALGVVLLTNHVENCVLGSDNGDRHAVAKGMKPEELVEELRTALARFLG
jgi:CsoR family transcriptional regulator, copper-sensing transcriptional repressor